MNLSKADIKSLSNKGQENVNRKKKLNLNGFKLFMEFLTRRKERTSRNSCRQTTEVRDKVSAGSEMPTRFLLASTSFGSLHFHCPF